jgi:hypothetical protein
MSVAPQVLSATYHYAKCILTACIIKMWVKKKRSCPSPTPLNFPPDTWINVTLVARLLSPFAQKRCRCERNVRSFTNTTSHRKRFLLLLKRLAVRVLQYWCQLLAWLAYHMVHRAAAIWYEPLKLRRSWRYVGILGIWPEVTEFGSVATLAEALLRFISASARNITIGASW